MPQQPGTQAVDRAAALLLRVLSADSPPAFQDLVESTALPKSTVSRLLSSLERNLLVARDASGGLVPGPAVVDYASSRRPHDDLLRVAGPHLDRLGEASRETVNLAVPQATRVVQIAQVNSAYVLGASNWLDRPVPFHCSALGKVFLAFGTPIPKGRLERRTDRTITTRAALEAELREVGRRGYAVADGELEPGLVALAAPVLDATGIAVAAVSITGPSVRLTPAAVARLIPLVVGTADAIAKELGFPPRNRKAGAA